MDPPRFAGDRPDWTALGEMFGDLKRIWSELPDLQQRMLEITGQAWSDDRMIRAVVGVRGHLIELEIDPRVYRKPDSKALAATIVATVRSATEDAKRQTKEIIDGSLPSDMRLHNIGGMDIDEVAYGHDGDLRRKKDIDGG